MRSMHRDLANETLTEQLTARGSLACAATNLRIPPSCSETRVAAGLLDNSRLRKHGPVTNDNTGIVVQ